MKAIITIGVSASGKSTWADEYFLNHLLTGHVERDKIRAIILNEKTSGETCGRLIWSKWNWKWEKEVTERVWNSIQSFAIGGYNIIISDTNLNRDRLNEMKRKLVELGYDEIEEKTFPISFKDAVARDAARVNGVGVSVIAKQFEQWDDLFTEQYIPPIDKPFAAIFDIDGTLANMDTTSRRPYDWYRVGEDSVHLHTAEVLRGLHARGYKILITSGRDAVCRQETIDWFVLNDIPYDELFMRPENDVRPDVIVKKELFFNHIASNYQVQMVFDDRPVVCRGWRSMGLEVFQLGNPYIEF